MSRIDVFLKDMEEDAYDAPPAKKRHREYANLTGTYEKPYRPTVSGAWPPNTDFSQDNLRVWD